MSMFFSCRASSGVDMKLLHHDFAPKKKKLLFFIHKTSTIFKHEIVLFYTLKKVLFLHMKISSIF